MDKSSAGREVQGVGKASEIRTRCTRTRIRRYDFAKANELLNLYKERADVVKADGGSREAGSEERDQEGFYWHGTV
jgi:hypothetical protein